MINRYVLIFTLLGIMSFVCLPLHGQEEGGTESTKEEKTFMLSFQLPIFDLLYQENARPPRDFEGEIAGEGQHYKLTFDLTANPAATLLVGFKLLEQWWLMANFGFKLHFAGSIDRDIVAGVGTRIDFPFRSGVGFCGILFDYAYRYSDFTSPYKYHGINLVGFGGAEYLATDFFGVGAQARIGFLWYKASAAVSVGISEESFRQLYVQGLIFAILGSLSFYF